MTQFYYEKDADLAAVAGQSVAVVGYGNQGRPWALNLRDSGLNPRVCVRNDDTRVQAEKDGFATGSIKEAEQADIVCILVPDDAVLYPGHLYSPEPSAPMGEVRHRNYVFRPKTKDQWMMMFGN